MNGIINVLKPPGMTSHDVVYFIRKITKIKKVGHTGTLDPEAAGVLPICIGKATKVVQHITDKKKRYRAIIKFGVVTDTYDIYGQVLQTHKNVNINSDELERAISSFIGIIKQVPPIYSAIKVNGKKLYEYALQREEVTIEGRNIEIFEIRIVKMMKPDEAMIDIYCSKGTYIRSLCYDIGAKLGVGACMSQLIRTEATPFTLADSVTIEEIDFISKNGELGSVLQPIEKVFLNYEILKIKDTAKIAVINRNNLYSQGVLPGYSLDSFEIGTNLRIYDSNKFLGIGSIKYSEEENRRYVKIDNIFI